MVNGGTGKVTAGYKKVWDFFLELSSRLGGPGRTFQVMVEPIALLPLFLQVGFQELQAHKIVTL
jgi:hypothetical protein